MVSYLNIILTQPPEEIVGAAPNPANDHLFNVRDDKYMRLLYEERERKFHKSVASWMFFMTICRHYIKTAVKFLCKMVLHQYEDDWGKSKRLMK